MIGERLGKWIISQEIGRGGMGRVFLAQEEMGDGKVAIKVLAPELAQESGFLHRFQREIDTLRLLDHPGIVRFFESGYEGGHYYYAMEYIEGQSLDELLHAQGRLPWDQVLEIALKICPALRHAHDHGIIHRDIKPPNILVTHDGQVKLTDFGIAKVFASGQLTATGGVVGTAEFLSPEQAAGKPVSKRSDLYSLGVVLYLLITARHPFEGTSFVDLLHKHRYAQFDRPIKLVPELPYEIDELICQLLDKDPAKRPADCLVLAKQLELLRRKLDRKSSHTQAETQRQDTVAEGRPELGLVEGGVGPATIMSQLMRVELARQQAQHPLSRLINRVWVLVPLLALCIGVIVWTFWPMSAQALFERGAELMAKENPADWELAWREYFAPLNKRYPEHPYQKELEEFREKLEASRQRTGSEARRFFSQADRLRQEGQFVQAKRIWENVVQVFQHVPAEAEWVRKSQQALKELGATASAKERWQAVRPALDRAAKLRDAGERAKAEQIWTAVEELYRHDFFAREILDEIDKARKK